MRNQPIPSPVPRLEAMLADALLGNDSVLASSLRRALFCAMDREAFAKDTLDTTRPLVLK